MTVERRGAAIDIVGVRKEYASAAGHVLALDGIDLTIAAGEFLCIVGPSGCGKSTLLRMLAGLENITAGEIRIGGKVVNQMPPKERDIAMVFQNYALYPHMTVYDNIGFALKLAKVPKKEIDDRVRKAASILELEANLDRKPGQLSGGQRQRVAMGRAIVRQPAAFLMDEPLSNLDAKLRVQMRAEIASIQRDLGVTTVYVTHDQVEAMTMGDRVAVLKDGYLQQVDTPQNLYDRPDNVFVGAFIGSPSMNLFSASISLDGAGGTITLGSATLALAPQSLEDRPGLRAYDGKQVIVGIRPEDFEDAELAENVPQDRRLQSTAHLIEALGSEIIAAGTIDEWAQEQGFADNEAAVAGATLFAQSGCLNCHTYLGEGNGNLGAPDLSDVGASDRGIEFFKSYVSNPAQYGNNVMISYAYLGDENLTNLATFLDASRGGESADGG